MAKLAKEVFFVNEETIIVAARCSTQGNPQNAVALLSRLQPTYIVYTSDTNVCTLNGFLRIPIAALQKICPRDASSIRYHCDDEQMLKFKVPLQETLLLQTHVLLSCGPDFAQQYVTDCYMHHVQNEFVRALYKSVMDLLSMFPRWYALERQGMECTRYSLKLCASVLIRIPEAKRELEKLLHTTELRCDHNYHLFMCIWDSVQQALGLHHAVVPEKNYRRRPSKYTPKSVVYKEELRLYHPDDFDRILIFTLIHKGWIKKEPMVKPSRFAKFWTLMGV